MNKRKWVLPALLSLLLTGVIFVWALFCNWGVPYFTAHFTFGRMVLPFILFFLFAMLIIRFLVFVIAELKRIRNLSPEERAAEQQKRLALQEKMQQSRAEIRENNAPARQVDNTPKCPKCGSTSIAANQKGFGIGKAVVGAAVAGPLGLMAGNVGAKKVYITCLNCGHRWQAGKK